MELSHRRYALCWCAVLILVLFEPGGSEAKRNFLELISKIAVAPKAPEAKPSKLKGGTPREENPIERKDFGNCKSSSIGPALGSMDKLSREGLVASVLYQGKGNPLQHGPRVKILEHRIVCKVAGSRKGTVGSLSVEVHYWCQGVRGDSKDSNCSHNIQQRKELFQFDCHPKSGHRMGFFPPSAKRTAVDLNAPKVVPRDKCGLCTDFISDMDHDATTQCACKFLSRAAIH